MFRSEEDAAHRFRRSCARGCPVNEKRARRPFGRRARLTIPSGSSQCRFVRCFAHPSGSSQCRFSAGDLCAAPARTSFPRLWFARPAALRTRRVHPNAAFRPATFARRRRGRPSRARCSPGPLLCAPEARPADADRRQCKRKEATGASFLLWLPLLDSNQRHCG